MSGVCSDCRHWRRDVVVEPVEGKRYQLQGECEGIPTCWDWRLSDGEPGDGALMVDANARLFTAPTFGCELWEQSDV